MNGYDRRKEQKEEAILESALILFSHKGLRKTSIAEIAKEAHVSQVTIFKYFATKENLIEQVYFKYYEQVLDYYKNVIEKPVSFEEKIKEFIFEKTNISHNIHDEFLSGAMYTYPSTQTFIDQDFYGKTIELSKRLIHQGKDEGIINKNLSDEAILVYIDMTTKYSQDKEHVPTILSMGSELMDLFLYGLYGKDSR